MLIGMPSPVPSISISTVVELVNEWATVPQEVSLHPWAGYPGADNHARAELRQVWPQELPEPGDEMIVEAADRIHTVFSATWPNEVASALTGLVSELRISPMATSRNDEVHTGWSVPDQGDLLTVMLAVSLLDHLKIEPTSRLGICESSSCADILVDHSPSRSKHYCSVRCRTRERVRDHRARNTNS